MNRFMLSSIMQNFSENAKSGIACFDIEGKCIFINKVGSLIFSEGTSATISAENYRQKILSENFNSQFEEEFKDYFVIKEKKHVFLVLYKQILDEKGRFQGSYLKFDDKTNESKIYEDEHYFATHDILTGLYNKETFFIKASEEIRKKPQISWIMLATDIEKFKLVNELFGESFGDKLLKAQADFMEEIKCENMTCGRISGDKFAVLVPKEDFKPELVMQIKRKMQECFNGIEYTLHIYVGLYEFKNSEESVEQMFDKAYIALKEISGNYGLTMAYYDSNMMQKNVYENQILNGFNEAIRKKQIIMFLQPMFSEEGKILGAEVLPKWKHPDFGLLDPLDFMQILENSDGIFEMNKIVWEAAAKKISEWEKLGWNKMYLSVNISSKDFYFDDIFKLFSSLIKKYKISPSSLKLEITEKSVVQNLKLQKKVIENLKNLGIGIILDKFGTGISSLENLNNISLDAIKIDMGFLTKSYVSDKKYKKILESLKKVSKDLNMVIFSEGISTKEQFEFLKKNGYNIFQGDFFAKPIPCALFEEEYSKELEK